MGGARERHDCASRWRHRRYSCLDTSQELGSRVILQGNRVASRMRRIFVPALLRLLLPDSSLAQPNEPGPQGAPSGSASRQAAPTSGPGQDTGSATDGAGKACREASGGAAVAGARCAEGFQCLHAATSSGIGADISPASVARFRNPPGWGYRRWTVRRVLLAPNVRPGREHGCNCASAAQVGAVVSSVVARTCAALCGASPLTEHGSNPSWPDPTRSSHPRDANPVVVTGRPALLGHAPIRTYSRIVDRRRSGWSQCAPADRPRYPRTRSFATGRPPCSQETSCQVL
jgi:hypothetical protein